MNTVVVEKSVDDFILDFVDGDGVSAGFFGRPNGYPTPTCACTPRGVSDVRLFGALRIDKV